MSDYGCGAVTAPLILGIDPVTQIGMNKLNGNFSLAVTKTETSYKGKHIYLVTITSPVLANQENTTQNKGSAVGHYFPLLLYF